MSQPTARPHATRRSRFVASGLALLAILVSLLGASPRAVALSGDPEAYGQWVGGFWHGSYQEGSALVFCLDQSRPTPYGHAMLGSAKAKAGWRGLSADRLAGLNWLVATYGGSTDPMTARSVQEAVWAITGTAISGGRSALADEMIQAVDAYRVEPTKLTGVAEVAVDLADDGRTGTVTLKRLDASPSKEPITGELVLENAVFRGGSSTVRTGTFKQGQTFKVDVVPPTDRATFRVKATITAESSRMVFAPWITYIDYDGDDTFQDMIAVEREDKREQVVALEDLGRSALIDRSFQPTATTRVTAATVDPGSEVRDRVDVTVTSGSWPDGAKVTFSGTAYGRAKLAEPNQAHPIPASAKVLGTVSITADGPGSYTSPPVTVPKEGVSHVVWVWRVVKADQSDPVRALIIDDWRDDFGVPSETQLVRFTPKLTTRVESRVVTAGRPLVDVVEASAASGYWPAGLALTARGRLYGPLAGPPTERAKAPASAPIAEEVTLTLGGPGTYRTPSSVIAKESGYYTWVWEIVAADQSAEARARLGAGFLDRFGIAAETHVVPNRLEIATDVASDVVAPGEAAGDTVTIASAGPWPQLSGGAAAPIVLTGEAWYVESDARPVRQSEVPNDATRIGTVTRSVSSAGTFDTPTVTAPLAPDEPGAAHGWIVWVWSLDPAAQREEVRERVTAWRDDFATPDEIQRVEFPGVTTAAVAGVGFGGLRLADDAPAAPSGDSGPIDGSAAGGAGSAVAGQSMPVPIGGTPPRAVDVAMVTGPLPVSGATLVFEAFQVPMTVDGLPEDPSLASVCTADQRIALVEHPSPVTEPGEYRSPEVVVPEYGLVVWRASLMSRPADGEPQLITREACGIERETTVVVDLATRALILGSAPDPQLQDEAIVTGWVPPGSTLRFDAYEHPAGEPIDCAPERRAWTSGAVPVEGGLHGRAAPLRITSDAWRPTNVAAGTTIAWIAKLTDASGRPIAEGDCGDPTETIVVPEAPDAPPSTPPAPPTPPTPDTPPTPEAPPTQPPVLAWTGLDGRAQRALGVAGVGLVATGLCVGALASRLRAAAAGARSPRRARSGDRDTAR